MTVVLLDTDICIYLLNQRPGFESILKRMDGREHGAVDLSAITRAELRFGIAARRRRALNVTKLELFLASFEVVSFDDRAAAVYGPVRALLEDQGTPIGPLDTLIAAHALSLYATPSKLSRLLSRCTAARASQAFGVKVFLHPLQAFWVGE